MTQPTTTKLTFTDPVLVVAFTRTADGANAAEFNAFDTTQPEAVAMLRLAANKLEELHTRQLLEAGA